MVAMAILSFVMLGLYQFTMDTSRMLYSGVNRIDLDASMRRFSQTFETDIQTADAFYLYKSFLASDRQDNDGEDRLEVGDTGDFLLLVFTEPQPNTNSTVYITKLVCYFRKYASSGLITDWGSVCRKEIDYADQTIVASGNTVESLIANYAYTNDYPQIVMKAKGLFTDRLFYMLTTSSVKVKMEIYRGSVAGYTTEVQYLTGALR